LGAINPAGFVQQCSGGRSMTILREDGVHEYLTCPPAGAPVRPAIGAFKQTSAPGSGIQDRGIWGVNRHGQNRGSGKAGARKRPMCAAIGAFINAAALVGSGINHGRICGVDGQFLDRTTLRPYRVSLCRQGLHAVQAANDDEPEPDLGATKNPGHLDLLNRDSAANINPLSSSAKGMLYCSL